MTGFLALLVCFIIIDRAYPIKTDLDYSQIIISEDGTLLHAFLNDKDKWRMKIGLDEINDQLQQIIIFKEDKFFYYHFGINPFSVIKALVNNAIKGERVSGASTITMQVARLLEPKPRTYRNKFIEMFRALQLEWHLSKREILKLYLNLAPYGGNIEGVKSASFLYFQQPPQALSLAQITVLTIIPNDPGNLRIGQNNSFIMESRNKWLQFFENRGLFDSETIEDALAEPLTAYRHQAPKMIPHLANRIHQRSPNIPIVKTYINISRQEQIEDIVYNYVQRTKLRGINNASVMVIDNKTMGVVAYLGSNDFYDDEHQGQVDGVVAVRSPGSTLKPYLYAMAFERGFATPKMKLSDIPVNYRGYEPENYDEKYHGWITIEKALALSLNVPAVKILDQIDYRYFIEYLIKGGFRTIANSKEDLGLSLILGGCGATLEELTHFYTAFANGGTLSPVLYYHEKEDFATDTLFHPGTAFMITEILTQLTRPDLPNEFQSAVNVPKIAWKTGTSYGRRDGWSIGYNPDYTIGVWIGNFPGNGIPELSGSEFAAPLLFRIFNYLDDKNRGDWFIEPDDLDIRLVCTETGLPPNEFCEDLILDHYLPGISKSKRCQHLKQYLTDPEYQISYCRTCLPQSEYKIHWYRNYPPDMISYFNEHNIPYEKVPPHNPDCQRIFENEAPVIVSLTEGSEYILLKDENQQLKLACQAEADVNRVYWYVNDHFLGSAGVEEDVFYRPKSGKQKISCTDDKGRNVDIWVSVRFI